MKRHLLQYARLTAKDNDLPFLAELHTTPEIAKYIRIDPLRYFDYVTNTADVCYFKVLWNNLIVAAVHVEKKGTVLYVSLFTLPEYQRKGVASQILADIKAGKVVQDISEIIAFVDKTNAPSLRLFEKTGFMKAGEEEELLEYRLSV